MTAYYNEIDPYAAQWLRNLISAGHIAPGDVDERSIEDVRPDDLRGYRQCHFFAGIGVWSYSLRLAGWPDDRPVWTGSCPCQPFSAAGKRGGVADERHLWPAFFHLIGVCRPPVVLGEQVASKDGLGWLDIVQADLEREGYACGAVDTCSAGSGAPHIRQRLRFVAERLEHAALNGREQWRPEPGERSLGARRLAERLADADDPRLEGRLGTAERGAELAARAGSLDGGLADAERFGREMALQHTRVGRPSSDERQANVAGGCSPPIGGSGPTNGFWRAADWLFCRDGKWRPVEPLAQPMVDGSAPSLGRVRPGHVEEIEIEIAEWSIRHQADAGKALHDLRVSLSARAQREWPAGRLPGLHEAPFLLAFLRQLSEQGWTFAECVSGESPEIAEARLRVLRHDEEAARASCERGLDGQSPGERADALRVLSSILARHAQEAWGLAYEPYAAAGFPLAHGARSRVGRLRAYGNAVDAQATKHFIEAYLDTERLRLTGTSTMTIDKGAFG